MPSRHRRYARVLASLLPVSLLGLAAVGAPPLPPRSSQPVPHQNPAPTRLTAVTLNAAAQKEFDADIRPQITQLCVGCHGAEKPSAGVNVARFTTVEAIRKDPETWRKILAQVRDKAMPPTGMPQPTDTQRARLVGWIEETLEKQVGPPNPGSVVLHRLNRTEYNNTIRDLLGVDTKPADAFPADGSGGGGFDNNADTLFIPPVLMERYLQAASDVLTAASPARLFPVRPSAKVPARTAARTCIARLADHAFRRPAEKGEIDRLLTLYDIAAKRGDSWEPSVRFALKGVLVSPHFLFRVEQERSGGATGEARPLGDYELASRLSYFLWSSMPDVTLFKLASTGKLRDPAVLEAQTKRMLADPKAAALADGFAGQWLRLRELYTSARPDPGRFLEWTPEVRNAAFQEPVLLFNSVVRENRNLYRLLSSDYTYLNEPLAKLYGIPGITGPQMRRVQLVDRKRGGVLTTAGVLAITSYPRRTSPVLRGKWVLEEILGAPAPPPPASVATLGQEDGKNKEGLTFRQRLEQHRSKPACAGCHARMDPLGFGLENYDPIGRWRTMLGDTPVDTSGKLTTGEEFAGPEALKTILLTRKEAFARNLAEKMLAYALGRGLEAHDLPAVRKITNALAQNDYRAATLVLEVVKSYPFRYRKG